MARGKRGGKSADVPDSAAVIALRSKLRVEMMMPNKGLSGSKSTLTMSGA